MKHMIRTCMVLAFVAAPVLADEAALLTALSALEGHVKGTATLTSTQIASHKATLDANKTIFGDTAATISASFNLVQSYDQNIGPMWSLGSPTQNGFNRNSVTTDIHWTVYHAMQYIMDDTYNSGNLQTQSSLLSGYKFGSAAVFPGPVAPPSDPNVSYTVSIDGSFLETFGRDTQHWTFPARKATGTYLVPGSIATITVPEALVGKGYQVRVEGHSWDMANRAPVDRLERSSLLYNIDSTQVQVASPLGGSIYIEVPYRADAGVVDVQIQNVVRSPFFSMQDFKTTTLEEWQNTERHHPGPWADFQTEKFMANVPTSWIYSLEDPVSTMQEWERAMDVINDLMGFPRDRGKETLFLQVDVRTRSSVFAPGYPTVNDTYNPDSTYNGNVNSYILRGPEFAPYYAFHEQGHSYFFPKFPGESESAVNLLHVPVQQMLYGKSWDYALAGSMGEQGNPHRTLDNTAVEWMTSFNFSPREVPMHEAEKSYQLKGHAKFVEIARLFGWDKLGDYWYSFNEDLENGVASPTSIDGMLLRLSQKVGVDVTPLFHFWGVHPDNVATLRTSMQAAGLLQSQEIYDLLKHYRDLIPADNAAFRTFALNWWGRQPSVNGYWTESEHARQWDETPDYLGEGDTEQRPNGEIYTEDSAADIRDVVNRLIKLYFPSPFLNFPLADLDLDLNVTGSDWLMFRNGIHANLQGLSEQQAYLLGDLDGDGDNDIYDFDLFRKTYELYHPEPGAFAAMLIATAQNDVPEPGALATLTVFLLTAMRRRLPRSPIVGNLGKGADSVLS